MMFVNRVPNSLLLDQLSADTYDPVLIKNIAKVGNGEKLASFLLREPKLGVTGTIAEFYVSGDVPGAVPYLTTKQVNGLFAYAENCKYINSDADVVWAKCRVRNGAILINKSGNVGAAALLSIPHLPYVNTVSDLINISIKSGSDGFDPAFLVVYLNSPYAQDQLRRLSGGAIFSHVSIYAIPQVRTYRPQYPVQTYIGNKVRQAERLRAIGSKTQATAVSLLEALLYKYIAENDALGALQDESSLSSQIEESLRQIKLNGLPNEEKMIRQSRVPFGEMTERLDAGYYRQDFLANAKALACCGLKIEQIESLCEKCNCGATPVDVEYELDGQGLIRTSDVRPNRFHENTVMRTRRLDVDGDSPVAAIAGDILFTMSGTIGYAAVIPKTEEIFSFSNTIARARVKPPNNPWFVAGFFNSSMGYMQSLRLTSGGIQGHVMPNPFKQLFVPVPDPRIQDFIGDKLQVADRVTRTSECLLASAKLLVEALIEQKLADEELINAQNQLEKGEDSADRSILSRLYEGGWDAKETRPLFPDLDTYYETLRMIEGEQTEIAAK